MSSCQLDAAMIFETSGSLLTETDGLAAVEKEAVQARLDWLEVSVPSGLYVNLDGEPVHATDFRFEIQRRGLKMHLPPTAPLQASGGGSRGGKHE